MAEAASADAVDSAISGAAARDFQFYWQPFDACIPCKFVSAQKLTRAFTQ
jgi:hypothetical protein